MMYLVLENINKIKKARVKVGGLTVITGENDTGKSTVGKVLFSMIKALIRQKIDIEETRHQQILSLVEDFYSKYLALIPVNELEIFKKEFFPPEFIRQRDFANGNAEAFFNEKKDTVRNLTLPASQKEKMVADLELISDAHLTGNNEEIIFSQIMNQIIHSEFYSKICSTESGNSCILLEENDRLMTVTCNENAGNIAKTAISTEMLSDKPFADATFIETPLYMQMKDVIDKTGTIYDIDEKNKYLPKVPLHIKDLLRKMEYAKYMDKRNGLSTLISQTIQGEFVFDKTENDFVFKRNIKGKDIMLQTSNVASGIKVFGMIQLLLDAGEIGPQKILILDEPENHLHPQWQLTFAHLLVQLVKNRIPVVLTSHSPYFIQAINHFSEKEGIREDVSYYLAEVSEGETLAVIEDVTDDLNRIFAKLAEPLQDIIS